MRGQLVRIFLFSTSLIQFRILLTFSFPRSIWEIVRTDFEAGSLLLQLRCWRIIFESPFGRHFGTLLVEFGVPFLKVVVFVVTSKGCDLIWTVPGYLYEVPYLHTVL